MTCHVIFQAYGFVSLVLVWKSKTIWKRSCKRRIHLSSVFEKTPRSCEIWQDLNRVNHANVRKFVSNSLLATESTTAGYGSKRLNEIQTSLIVFQSYSNCCKLRYKTKELQALFGHPFFPFVSVGSRRKRLLKIGFRSLKLGAVITQQPHHSVCKLPEVEKRTTGSASTGKWEIIKWKMS